MSDEKPEDDPLHVVEVEGLTRMQNIVLSVFQQTGNMSKACRLAGCNSSMHRHWLKKNETYRVAYESCRTIITSAIEESLVFKLINGWREPVFQKGELVGYKRKFDINGMLKYLAKAKPEVFGDKVEVDSSLEGVSPEEMVKAMSATVPIVEEDDSDT